jgi:hypothetical protein
VPAVEFGAQVSETEEMQQQVVEDGALQGFGYLGV